MSTFSERMAALSPKQRALLELRVKQRGLAASKIPIIPQSHAGDAFPLSYAQERLWFLNQLTPDSPAYNIPLAVQLVGPLDLTALQRSLNAIIQRHAILRTSFRLTAGHLVQVVAPTLVLRLRVLELGELPAAHQHAARMRLAVAEFRRPFDLVNGPLLRVTLLRLADATTVLLTMQHIISDGWSVGIFFQELMSLYEAFSHARPAPLPALPIQYVDYAIWQRQWLDSEGTLADQLAYWRAQLDGLAMLNLPTDRPRPPALSDRGARQPLLIARDSTDALRDLSQHEGVTLFMTLLAALQSLLARYAGQTDIGVGTPIANRSRPEIEQLIGFFVNTLVLRVDLAGNPRFRDVLKRVRAVCLDAYAHQDLPFEKLVEALQPQRDLGRNPLFQVHFTLQTSALPDTGVTSLSLSLLDIDNRTAKFDLLIELVETAQGLLGAFEYNTDLFDATTIMRLVSHLRTLIGGIAANPDQRLADLPLLTAAERQQLLAEWGAARAQYPPAATLHQLFEAQAARQPDAIALVFDFRDKQTSRQADKQTTGRTTNDASAFSLQPSAFSLQLTYAELNHRANQLAQHLQALGVGPDVLVGIAMERSLELVVGLLGILKAGGAYVPLDPTYPAERLRFMLDDAQVAVLLTATKDERPTTNDEETQPESLHDLGLTINVMRASPAAIQNPKSKIQNPTPDNLAYVIYTSGSTGTPKGVMVCHRNVTRLLDATSERFGFDARDVWSLFHSTAFDFSVWELWGALGYGGRLVVVPYWVSRTPDACYALLAREKVSVLNQTPAAFRQLMQAETHASGLALRLVIFGGEALDMRSLRPWFARQGEQSPQLVNMYGITETTVHVTYRRLGLADLDATSSLIGAPLPDLQLYLLDRRRQPVPIGVTGELYVGGAGVARGYLNRPDLTAERFVPNPWGSGVRVQGSGETDRTPERSGAEVTKGDEDGVQGSGETDRTPEPRPLNPEPSARLYKTGDLARYLPNGELVFLGRIDDQVKVRGFRIEPGEIETVLRQHGAVQACVVVARADRPGDMRLVAYVVEGSGVGDQGAGSEDTETRRHGDTETPSLPTAADRMDTLDRDRRGTIYRAPTIDDRTGLIERDPTIDDYKGTIYRASTTSDEADPSIVHRPSSFVQELRAFLKAQLPDYMIPSAFVLLDVLPLNANGKLDRRMLPAPDGDQANAPNRFVAPGTPAEEIVAQIWSEVLGIERVGLSDNFFDLGGHSLLATQVVSRVHDLFRVELSVRSVFETPTVAGVVSEIARLWGERATVEQIALAYKEREHGVDVAARLNQQGISLPAAPAIPRRSGAGPYPLSFAQQRLWFFDQLAPGNPAYNLPAAVRLTGRLDIAALSRSLNRLIQRHESLRTTFALIDDLPVQIIAPARPLALALLDLSALAERQRAAQSQRLATELARQPFDLARGPLIRAALVRLDPLDQIVLLTLHHSIADGWSISVFTRELAAFYRADISGTTAALPELPIQYADYAIWQRAWLQATADADQPSPLQAQLAYWRAQLAGRLPLLELPTDRPRPALQTWAGSAQALVLPQSTAERLTTFSQRAEVSLFMTLLAAFKTLLHRYTGQTDILVGSPIANRTRPETEGVVGCFVNTLVLRSDLAGNPTFRVLLERVREITLAAYAHQDVPFEQLVEELQPERNISHTPLFQVLFVLQNTPTPTLELPGLTLSTLATSSGTVKFDLTLAIVETQHSLAIIAEYATDLFDATTMLRLLAHLRVLLAAVAVDPQQRLADLPLLTNAERSQLVVQWNDTRSGARGQGSGVRSRIAEACLHELFEAQAERTPDAIALAFDFRDKETRRQGAKEMTRDQGSGIRGQDSRMPAPDPRTLNPDPCCLTYRELNRRANQLAQHLQALGVGPDVLVGICLERSLELVVGLLGILKAGGAYLPLDPSYPAERLAFMLDDAQARVLITRQRLDDGRWTMDDESASAQPIVNGPSSIVNLAADWSRIAGGSAENLANRTHPDNLAYMIYTSGSTGQPKGALNSHRAISNRLRWMQDAFQLTARDVVLQKTPFSFDVSVWEFFWPLLTGARLVLARPGGHQDPAYLRALIARSHITTCHFVPALLQLFLDEPDLASCRSLRRVICSGEALSAELQLRFFGRLGAQLHNLYGPTEAAVDVTCWRCEATSAQPSVPIGRPIANVQIYLLDRQLQPVPIGVAGELYIGGVQLARGYHSRPDLTAERFVPNPFADFGFWILDFGLDPIQNPKSKIQNGERLYKTGDLARYRADGVIEFLGRLDHQVKLRGFRIEPGEIETALTQHPAVQSCVVVARADRPGEQRLVAYVVQGSGVRDQGSAVETARRAVSTPDPRSLIPELRAFLATRLPDYMIPSAFVLLDTLPLNANGKVDRRALPVPDEARPASATSFAPPNTEAERILAAIWQAVLHIERVGVYDNFFDLGGHSLLLIQVRGQLRSALQREISILDLFRYPTISSLAHHLTQEQSSPPALSHSRAEARRETRGRQNELKQRRQALRQPQEAEDE